MAKMIQSFFDRWTVVPVLESRVFIVKDQNDAACPMLPISTDEYDRLRTANDAQSFRAMLVNLKEQGRRAKAHGHG
jgi:hypothetical protein